MGKPSTYFIIISYVANFGIIASRATPYNPTVEQDLLEATLTGGVSETITVLVGEEEAKFVIHKDILCVQSGFFAAAFKKEWMTSKDQPLRLPEEDPEIFKAFFYWIYRNRIVVPEAVYDKAGSSFDGPFGLLAKLWIMGDIYQMKSLQNDAIDGIITLHQDQDGLPAKVISLVYENTFQPSCGVCKLLVRIAETTYEAKNMDPEKTYFPPEFLLDMVRRGHEYKYASCHPKGADKYSTCRGNI